MTKNTFIKKTVILFSVVVLYASSHSYSTAQTTMPASGGNASGGGGSVSFTIGQIVYNTNSGSTGFVSQGVQQPYDISVITAIEETGNINISFSAYPNPVTDYLILKIEDYDTENLTYQLYNISGNLIENKKISGPETYIYVQNLISSTYFLKITHGSKELKVFKIIKNNL